MCFAVLGFVSCGTATNLASSDAAAQAAGLSCGQATASLYSVYKSTGKVDLTNSTNLSNALILATSYSQLKENKGNQAYRKAFTTGMVNAGTNIFTNSGLANTFVDKLLATSGLENVNSSNIANKAQTIIAIMSLINALK